MSACKPHKKIHIKSPSRAFQQQAQIGHNGVTQCDDRGLTSSNTWATGSVVSAVCSFLALFSLSCFLRSFRFSSYSFFLTAAVSRWGCAATGGELPALLTVCSTAVIVSPNVTVPLP